MLRPQEPAKTEGKAAPRADLVVRLRELAERLAQRAAVHPAVMADVVARELDAMAGELAAAGRGDAFARLERARHALRQLLGSGAAAAELEAILAEAGAALALVIAELETGRGGPGRRRDFWK